MILGFDHVQLAMPSGEEAAAVAFYADLLGLEHVGKPESLAGRGGCWFAAPGVAVHLGVEDGFRPARKAHPALLVDGLDELVSRLESAGVEVRLGDTVDGRVQRFCDDPFGNRIELVGTDG